MIAVALFFIVLGCAVGSFGNVLICRLASGESIGGRSHCMQCRRTLAWFELIPVVSYLFLRARCRTCKAAIAAQYPLVEIASGALFLLALLEQQNDHLTALLVSVLLSFLLFTAVFDAYYQRIPDVLSEVIGALGLLIAFRHGLIPQAIFGAAAALVWFGGQWMISRGKWIGEGDIILAVALGCWLGLADTVAMILLSYIVGTVVLLPILLWRRRTLVQSRIAFAPFLALGALFAFLGVGRWYLGVVGF